MLHLYQKVNFRLLNFRPAVSTFSKAIFPKMVSFPGKIVRQAATTQRPCFTSLKCRRMKAFSINGIGTLVKDSFKSFLDDKVPKLGGSLAYFTIFSIGPMLLVIIFLVGIFLGKQAVAGSLH